MEPPYTIDYFRVGRKAVSAVAAQLTTVPLSDGCHYGVCIKAMGPLDAVPNTVPVNVGEGDVTITSGFPLGPGESFTVPVKDPSKIWVVSSATANVAWALA